MRKSSKLLVATAAAALVATGGSAFTAGNTVVGNNVAGYGTATVSGATTTGIEHTLSGDGKTVTSTLLTFSTDLVADHSVKAGFGTAALVECVEDLVDNTAVCSYTSDNATASATEFNVAVS